MVMPLHDLQHKVQSQKKTIPELYGNIDFTVTPERFTDDIGIESAMPSKLARKYRSKILSSEENIERFRAYTMLGDTVADAYAALLPEYGLHKLIEMLKQACDGGIDSVPNAPTELKHFIDAMETIPKWLDMDLVEKGARTSRIHMATIVPFALRGTFVATFMNKYSGLPMALTGSLSSQSSVQRVNETGSFFTTATLPGALKRQGVAFKAAAMVRLMHSMVRFNILKRTQAWDVSIYGIPIPQIDQMPAGTIPAFLAAFTAVNKGRDYFTEREKGIVELCRYQSYLLGLPEDLLPSSPKAIVNVSLTYAATLRYGYDDSTCGELTRGTMSGYRPKTKSLMNRIYNACEKSYSTVFFARVFTVGDEKNIAKIMGVEATLRDYVLFFITNLYIMPRMMAHALLMRIPLLNELADKYLIHRINKLLVEYGHAEYTTDVKKYQGIKSD